MTYRPTNELDSAGYCPRSRTHGQYSDENSPCAAVKTWPTLFQEGPPTAIDLLPHGCGDFVGRVARSPAGVTTVDPPSTHCHRPFNRTVGVDLNTPDEYAFPQAGCMIF